MDAALALVVELVLGGADVRDGAGGGALPVAQVVKVVGPLDAELGRRRAARTAVGVRIRFAGVQLRQRAANDGDQQHDQNCTDDVGVNKLRYERWLIRVVTSGRFAHSIHLSWLDIVVRFVVQSKVM